MTEVAIEKQGMRPLLRRQLDALADWLARPNWTVTEAAALLIGILPAERSNGADFGPWLPGNEPWPQRETWEWAIKGDIDRMTARLATVDRLGLMASSDVLTLAVGKGIIPPWLTVAIGDPVCAALLPKTVKEEEQRKRRAIEGIATRNMKTKQRHEQSRALMVAHAHAVIAGLKIDGGFPADLMHGANPWKAEIIRKITKSWSGTYVQTRTIYEWMADGTLKL